MHKVMMTDIRRRRQKIKIPGGWIAKVPSIQLKNEDRDAFIRYYQSARGVSPIRAEEVIDDAMQGIFVKGWLLGLREMLVIRAQEYRTIFGTLDGFDPAKIQAAYVPGENTGRAGKPVVRKMLLLMGREAGLEPRGEGRGYVDDD